MPFYDNNFNISDSVHSISKVTALLPYIIKHNILVVSMDEFNEVSVDSFFENASVHNIELVFIYEWSGWASLPHNINNFPIQTFVFHYDFTLIPSSNYFYYPQWLLFVQWYKHLINDINPLYMFCCACRYFNHGRPGKIYNYELLKKKSYYDKILITKFKVGDFERSLIPELTNESLLNAFCLDYITWDSAPELVSTMSIIDIDVYKHSLFHIIAETRIEEPLLSEKTFKIFSAGQIPIMCGARHAIKHLRELGFDVFDDIVDHSYDNIENWKERINAMHVSLDKLVELDQLTLIKETEQRRISNNIHLHSVELTNTIIWPIVDIITLNTFVQ